EFRRVLFRSRHHPRTHLSSRPRIRTYGTKAGATRCGYSPGLGRCGECKPGDQRMSGVRTPITLALSKGRIFDETLPLLAATGIEVLEDLDRTRKLIIPTSNPDLRVIIVRASDVPTYVQYGAADIGVAGKDVLYEHQTMFPGG